jgi:ribosome-associated protein
MVEITPQTYIDENELEFAFVRADGPGGQNVNKVATAVQLRFDVLHSNSLSEEVKSRLSKLAGKRMTQDGILVIEAKRFRTQDRNREDALARFQALVQKALETPKSRKKTKPTQASQEERLKEKKRKGEIKRSRAKHSFEQD